MQIAFDTQRITAGHNGIGRNLPLHSEPSSNIRPSDLGLSFVPAMAALLVLGALRISLTYISLWVPVARRSPKKPSKRLTPSPGF